MPPIEVESILLEFDEGDEIAAALGNLILCWSHVDNCLRSAFLALSGANQQVGLRLFSKMPNLRGKLSALEDAISSRDDLENSADAVQAVKKLGKLAKARNNWIHGQWQKRPSTGEICLCEVPPTGASKTVRACDIKQHCTTAQEASVKLIDAVRHLIPRVIIKKEED